jgi:hypothetical protein
MVFSALRQGNLAAHAMALGMRGSIRLNYYISPEADIWQDQPRKYR